MPAFLLEHMPGCTPIVPCASCVAMNLLRNKLPENDFKELISEIERASGQNREYGSTNPAPNDAPVGILKEMSVRSANMLRNDAIQTIGDLVQKSADELLRTPSFGRKSLKEIEEALAKVGRHLEG